MTRVIANYTDPSPESIETFLADKTVLNSGEILFIPNASPILPDMYIGVGKTLSETPGFKRSTLQTLKDLLDSYTGHTHPISDVVNLATSLAGKAALVHTHDPADIVGLDLESLTDVAGTTAAANGQVLFKSAGVWGPSSALAALGAHTHAQSEITGLTAALAALTAQDVTHSTDITTLQGNRLLKTNNLSDLSDLVAALKNLGFVGFVFDYAGSALPSGFVWPMGQNLSRTTYADLFAKLNTTYGAGDGSTTFGIPDLRGRVVAGKDDMGGTSANRLTNQSGGLNGDVLGATGGAETHTLTTAQLATHNHGVTDPSHAHASAYELDGQSLPAGSNGVYSVMARSGTAYGGVSTTTALTGISIQNNGSGSAHNNVQPTFILNKIIFAGV